MLVRSEKRWVTAEADPRVAEDIARTMGVFPGDARALVTRGLVDHAEIEKFLQLAWRI